MTDDTTDTDEPATAGDATDPDPPASEEGVDRRRLIKWVTVLAFAVPVVVELLTFGSLLGNWLLPGADGSGDGGDAAATGTASPAEEAVGVGDELLPDAPPVETVEASEIRGGSSGSRTYVLRVAVENTTDASVGLRLAGITLHDGTTLESVSTTGRIPAGETGEVTGAWELPTDSMPAAVDVVLRRDGRETVVRSVQLERPPIRG